LRNATRSALAGLSSVLRRRDSSICSDSGPQAFLASSAAFLGVLCGQGLFCSSSEKVFDR
jgi:hypothetical protein